MIATLLAGAVTAHLVLTPGHVGVKFDIAPGWHIYWMNPGDTGMATKVTWKLPAGYKLGRFWWETPQVLAGPGEVSYGYEKSATILARIFPPKGKEGRSYKVTATLQWLECKETCIPGSVTLTMTVPGAVPPVDPAAYNLPYPGDFASNLSSAARTVGGVVLSFNLQTKAESAYFFPATGNLIAHTPTQEFKKTAQGFTLTMPKSEFTVTPPAKLDGVLVIRLPNGKSRSLIISTPIKGALK